MATLREKIAEAFLTKLGQSKAMDSEKIDQLRTLLTHNRKPKADDFVKIFTLPPGGDIK